MKLIYQHENRLLVSNAQNILENAGIETCLKNEFASSAAGELSPFDTWMQLWLLYENDINRAQQLLKNIEETSTQEDWTCKNCNETNGIGLDYCWNCSQTKKQA